MNKYITATVGFFLFLLAGRVYSVTVKDVDVVVTDKGMVVFISTDATNYREVPVPPPHRIVVDFPGSKYRVGKNRIDVGKGDLIAVRGGQFKPEIARVVLDVKRERPYKIQKTKTGFEILLVNDKKQTLEKKEDESKIEKLLGKETFSYSTKGKRDPFKPLIGWTVEEDTLLDVRNAQLVGIVWSPEERYALIEAQNGEIYRVKEGYRVKKGRVSKIGKKEVVFTLWELGRTERLTLGIKEKE